MNVLSYSANRQRKMRIQTLRLLTGGKLMLTGCLQLIDRLSTLRIFIILFS